MKLHFAGSRTVTSILHILCAAAALLLSAYLFPVPLPTLAGILLFAGNALGFLLTRSQGKRQERLLEDTTGTVKEMARQIAHGVSSFASGDMRYRLTMPGKPCLTEEGEAVAKRLRTGIDDFNSMTESPPKRICFVGANSYQEGRAAGENIARMLSGKGKIAYMIPMYTQVNHVLRMKGCRDYLAEYAPGIQNEGIFESRGNPPTAAEIALKACSETPDLSVIFITDGHTPSAVAEALAERKCRVQLVIFDATETNIGLLKQGKIASLIEQNPYGQAWNALVHLYNACEASWKPTTRKLFMDPIYIDKANYATYWDDGRNRRIMKEDERSQLTVPAPNRSGKKYRFGIIMPQKTGFFAALVEGAEAAASKLSEYGVEVELVDAYHAQEDFGSAGLYCPIIQSFIDRKFDGFMTSIIDPQVMKCVNKAVESGLKATTFSTEPSSFREIILTLMDNAEGLMGASQNLASAAEESARANIQIGLSISGIRDDMDEQQSSVSDTENRLEQLNRTMETMKASLDSYTELVRKMSAESTGGAEEMDAAVRESGELRTAIASIEHALVSFSEKLGSVKDFAGVIEGLAESTNVLAINASIQAARAGTAGKSFAVVAGEIRSLSANSRTAAENIRATVNDITGSMDEILEVSTGGSKLVDRNLAKTRGAQQTFSSITQGLRGSAESIQTIGESASEVAANGKTVKENLDAIATATGSTAERIQEISIAIAQLERQGSSLSETANSLLDMAANQKVAFSQLSVKDTEKAPGRSTR